MDKPLRILIVDDHFVVRQGLKLILSEYFISAEFGEAADGNEALNAVMTSDWDVVLLDICMPGRGGLDALKDIKQAKPKVPIIVLSMHPEDQFSIRMLKLGAAGYIRKDSAGHDLVSAVTATLEGHHYITPTLAEKLATQLSHGQSDQADDSLSDREYQVMCMLASGKTVKEIGVDLCLSVKTVSTYRTRILDKLELANNLQIMRYAVQRGLVDTVDVS